MAMFHGLNAFTNVCRMFTLERLDCMSLFRYDCLVEKTVVLEDYAYRNKSY